MTPESNRFVTVPEAQTIMIKPYDKTILKDVEKAIHLADLNLVPINDGNVIRINFPPLTEERRRKLMQRSEGDCGKLESGDP